MEFQGCPTNSQWSGIGWRLVFHRYLQSVLKASRKGALRGEDCSVWYLSHCSLLIFAMRAASSRPRSCETEGRGSESRATWVQCEHLEASNGSLVFLGFLLVSFQNPPNGVLGFTETKKKNEETRICQVQALGTLPGLDQGPLV